MVGEVKKIEIYTDGACRGNPGPCAVGVVLKYGSTVKEFSKFLGKGTNNKAELQAILEALRMIKKPDIETLIFTDSSYAIGVLQKGWKAKANRGIIEEIKEEMRRFVNLTFVKVEGHSCVLLNEWADKLARECIDKHTKGFQGDKGISHGK
jgi:ribonuclease HI